MIGLGQRSLYGYLLRPGWSAGQVPGSEIFRTRPDRVWGLPSLLHIWYRISFSGVSWPGHIVDHLPTSSTEIKERVGLYLYSSSSPLLCLHGLF